MKAGSAPLVAQVVEAMTTNETFLRTRSFDHFRFDHAGDPAGARKPQRSDLDAPPLDGPGAVFRWQCAEGMGAALAGWRIEILATDLSQEVLEKSRRNLQPVRVQRGLPIQMLVKYFKQTGDSGRSTPTFGAMVQHRQLNLLHDFSQLASSTDLLPQRSDLLRSGHQDQHFHRLARIIEPDASRAWAAERDCRSAPMSSSPSRTGVACTAQRCTRDGRPGCRPRRGCAEGRCDGGG